MKLKNILGCGSVALALSLGLVACSDTLDLQPVDYPNAANFWENPNKVEPYMVGVHINLRGMAWTRTINFGELRGGIYAVGAGADGSSLRYGDIISQNLSEDRPGIGTFGGYYGPIHNLNLFIAKIEGLAYDEARKKYYLGQAHGLRALYYFDLYRNYGGVPLQLLPEVVDGVLDPNKLRKPRAEAAEVLAQIKSDITKSEEYFGSEKRFDLYGVGGQKSAWSPAATQMLKGEVYLWSAKVAIGNQPRVPQDLATAKTALLAVLSNYGLSLQTSFGRIFAANNKGNSEIILASRFADGEAASSGFSNYLHRPNQGTVKDLYRANGERFGDPLDLRGTGGLFVQYKNALYNLFDAADQRRDVTFYPAYNDKEGKNLAVALVHKFIGEINSQGNRVYTSDIIHYRLADAVLLLAEIANMEGNNTDVERYMNMIRSRAYGSEASSHLYTAGDFKTNELAILTERTKEFVQEGKRWYDLLRMQTAATGGKALVFDAEANIDGSTAPTLNEATEAFKVLWPVDMTLMSNDPTIKQTPGYSTRYNN